MTSPDSGPPPDLELQGVSKRFQGRVALHPIDLTFAARQTTALIGPSGCGKSTLLKILLGLVRPDAGDVRIAATRLDRSNLRRVRHRIGYVVQEGGLFPHLTARDNVTLLARHLRVRPAEIDRRVNALVELTAFPPGKIDQYPGELSGGQRQRVGLMRALMLDPDILLLDEPLGALDPLIRAELQEDLRRIFQSVGKTVVLVTHDLAEAAFFADRIVLLQEGRVVQTGQLADLIARPVDPFVTRFVRAQRVMKEAT